MKGLITAILDHFTEFTWKRLRSFLIVIFVIVGAFMIFDGYTSFFTMNRINRGVDIIAKLQAVENGGTMSPELKSSYESLRQQLLVALSSKPWASRISLPQMRLPHFGISYSGWLKFFAGSVPCGLLSLLFIRDIFKKRQGAASEFLGVWIIAFVFGVICWIVPTLWWPWFNLVIVPSGVFFGFIAFAVIISIKQAKKQRKNKDVEGEIESNA